mmetsp:Transcript_6362/g.17723  ORF Transcript_6362/g.17723 Transcript_6362/m.17723 type:complete len:202 (+) Transcript_6362:183-788(+)
MGSAFPTHFAYAGASGDAAIETTAASLGASTLPPIIDPNQSSPPTGAGTLSGTSGSGIGASCVASSPPGLPSSTSCTKGASRLPSAFWKSDANSDLTVTNLSLRLKAVTTFSGSGSGTGTVSRSLSSPSSLSSSSLSSALYLFKGALDALVGASGLYLPTSNPDDPATPAPRPRPEAAPPRPRPRRGADESSPSKELRTPA